MPASTTRSIPWLVAVFALAVIGGCQSNDEWRWDWWNKDASASKQRPVTKSRRAAPKSNVARTDRQPESEATPAQESTDPRSREVDAKVRRYVESMNQDNEGDGTYNDFNSKIARQQDPNRRGRIRDSAQSERREEQRMADAQPIGRQPFQPNDGIHRADSQERPQVADRETAARDSDPAPQPQEERTAPPQVMPAAFTGTEQPPSEDAQREPAQPEASRIERDPADTGVRTNVRAETTLQEPVKPTEDARVTPPPPVLDEIKITPAADTPVEAPRTTDASESPSAPVKAREPEDTFAYRLKAQKALVAKDPNNLAEQYRLRMWYLIDGQDDKALALSDDIDADKQEILQAQIRALMAARVVTGRDPAIGANQLLEPIENLHNIVRTRADLQVSRVALCRAVDAFGLYDPIEPAEFPAGRAIDVLLYIEVDNYRSDKMPSGFYRTLLTVRPSLLNKSGDELWNAKYENIEDLSRRQRRDFFLTIPEKIPASLAPGEYVLKVEVEDVLAGKINSNVAKFKLVLP
ncbi:MAG: hypothetical protein ABII12_15220 [Planctomycetota bacterium]